MAKVKNHVIYDVNDQDRLLRLAEEYTMLGREVKVEPGKLTVFALPKKRKKRSNGHI